MKSFPHAAVTALLLCLYCPLAKALPLDLDSSFGPSGPTPGFLLTPLAANVAGADVLPLPDGRVLIVSETSPGGSTNQQPGAVMLLANGSVDTSFGSNGVFTQDVIGGVNVEGFERVVQAADGGFVALASEGNAGQLDLIKLTASGQLDGSFGTGGRASLAASTLPGPGSSFQSTVVGPALAVDTQGRILLGVSYRRAVGSSTAEVHALCRFLPTGLLDASYSADGDGINGCLVGTSNAVNDQFSDIRGIVLDGDAAILVGSAVVNGQGGLFGALRATANGQLDPSFGTGGIVRGLPVNTVRGTGLAIARRADGRLLFAVTAGSGSGALLQLNADGSLDASFGGGDGIVSRSSSSNIDDLPGNARTPGLAQDIRDLVLQPDGRALVLARVSTGGSNPHTGVQVARYLPDGLPDLSFGELTALVRGPESAIGSSVQNMALASDGAIFIVGGRGGRTDNTVAAFVAKLRGGPDAAIAPAPFELADQFNVPTNSTRTSGAVTVSGLPDGVPVLLRSSQGAMLINGNSASGLNVVYNGDTVAAQHTSATTAGQRVVSLLRMSTGSSEQSSLFITTTANGQACAPGDLDPSFAADSSFGPGLRVFGDNSLTRDFNLLLQPDFRLLGSAVRQDNTGHLLELSRLVDIGNLDLDFNSSGQRRSPTLDGSRISIDGNPGTRMHDLLQLPSGQYLALLSTERDGQSLALAQFNADGGLDIGFGRGGAVHFSRTQLGLSTTNTTFRDLTLLRQEDGRLLLSLVFNNGFNANENGALLARLNADGSLDTSFAAADADGVAGIALIRQNPAPTGPVIRLQNGRPVLMLFDGNQSYSFFAFTTSGAADASFGTNGRAQVVTTNANLSSVTAQDFLVLPDARLLFTTRTAALGRLTANGLLDSSFGGDGLILRDDTGQGAGELTSDLQRLEAQRLVRQSDGKIVLMGSEFGGSGPTALRSFHFARFFADGLPDLGFGDDRIEITPSRGTVPLPRIEALHRTLLVDPTGRVLFGAHFGPDAGLEDRNHPIVGRLCGGASRSTRVTDFSLPDRSDVAQNSVQTSDAITIAGLPDGQPALIRVRNGQYSIGCTANFTSAMEKVVNGDTVCVRHTAAATAGTTVSTTLLLGGGPDEFSELFSTTTTAPSNPGSIQFDPASISVSESGAMAVLTVTRSGGTSGATTARISATGGTATAGVDFSGSDFTLQFADGEGGSKTATVLILDDGIDEPDETVVYSLSEQSSGGGGSSGPTFKALGPQATATLTIIDDEATPTISLSPATASVPENGGSQVFTATLSGPSSQTVTASYAYGGTATAGVDYPTPPAGVSFAPGATTASFTAVTIDDAVVEPDETVIVTIASATNAVAAAGTQIVVTIIDDDTPPPAPPAPVNPPAPAPPAPPAPTLQATGQSGGALSLGLLPILAAVAWRRRLLGVALLVGGVGSAQAQQAGEWAVGVSAGPSWAARSSGSLQSQLTRAGHQVSAEVDTRQIGYAIDLDYRHSPQFAWRASYAHLGHANAQVSGRSVSEPQLVRDIAEGLPRLGDVLALSAISHVPLAAGLEFEPSLGLFVLHGERKARTANARASTQHKLAGALLGLGFSGPLGMGNDLRWVSSFRFYGSAEPSAQFLFGAQYRWHP